MKGPNPNNSHPIAGVSQVSFSKSTVSNPQIVVGDYTYYDDPENSEDFERNVMYLFPFIGDKLIIGKFCAIGRDTKFIMNGANHELNGFSTYPFFIFGEGWEQDAPNQQDFPYKGDTVIGNDVWIGYDSLIMPGVTVGDGAIVASRSVVVTDVPPYTIVGGNPATQIKQRFAPETVSALLKIRWWNWEAEKITRNLGSIRSVDLNALSKAT